MDLTKHLTTRADDGHAAPVTEFRLSTHNNISIMCSKPALTAFTVILRMSSLGKVLRLPSN